jgi:ATP-dependent RNA helicase DDX56/DBP9
MKTEEETKEEPPTGTKRAMFADLGLDPRLVKAAAKRGWKEPTQVQLESIPQVLKGKDVVVQAVTGSGKTGSYVMPLIDCLLSKNTKGSEGWVALILVPTRELSEQIREEVADFLTLVGSELEVTSISSVSGGNLKNMLIANIGDIIVSTPGQIKFILEKKAISGELLLGKLQTLVLDEADLLLSYGYEKDLEYFSVHIPQSCQCSLFCATMTDDMDKLNKLVCTNPSIIQVANFTAAGESLGNSSLPELIDHFKAPCKTSDKLLNLTCLLKLHLVQKKVLVFVNTIDTGYKVRLFLEHFGIKSAVLNAELPLNSRHNIIKHFNKGNFDYLIATDIDKVKKVSSKGKDKGKAIKSKQGKAIDSDFGVVRGIDFKGVSSVINFDLSKTVEGYIHRVGRTGRAGSKGMCISLVPEGDSNEFLAKVENHLRGGDHAAVGVVENLVQPFDKLTSSLVDSLRYRAEDVTRAVTRAAVQEARAKELRMELLNSSKLKSHFQANPRDEIVLKHDSALSSSVPSHLKHIPKYLKQEAGLLKRRNTRSRVGKQNKRGKKSKSTMDILKEAVSTVK